MPEPPGLPFALDEYRSRLQRVQDEINARGLTGLVVFGPHNVYWLTGFETAAYFSPQAVLVPATGSPMVVVADEEEHSVIATSWVREYRTYALLGDPSERGTCIGRVIQDLEMGRGRLGMEVQASYFTSLDYQVLASALPDAELVDATDIVRMLRRTKSAREIAYVEAAARYCATGMEAALNLVRPGVREHELAGGLYDALIRAGSEYFGALYMSSGKHSTAVHGSWSARTIEAGDHVHLQLAANHRRYGSTLVRAIVLGKPTPMMERAADGSAAAIAAAEAEVRPGMTSDAVARLIRRAYREAAGFDPAFAMLGYSLGITFPPGMSEWNVLNISVGNRDVLTEDMTLHLVPLGQVEGVGTVGISESMLLTKDGLRPLASFERALLRA